MKKWIAMAALLLGGCTQITNYEQVVKVHAPPQLQGTWQNAGPQNKLISSESIASLIISPEGDTFDCRQWQRIIAKPGKLARLKGDWVNINKQLRVMPLTLEDGELHYDGLTLRKTDRPTVECQQALQELAGKPDAVVIQNIEPQIMRATFADKHNPQSPNNSAVSTENSHQLPQKK